METVELGAREFGRVLMRDGLEAHARARRCAGAAAAGAASSLRGTSICLLPRRRALNERTAASTAAIATTAPPTSSSIPPQRGQMASQRVGQLSVCRGNKPLQRGRLQQLEEHFIVLDHAEFERARSSIAS